MRHDSFFAQYFSVHQFSDEEQVVIPLKKSKESVIAGHRQNKDLENITSVSVAFRTAVTVRGVKSRWRGAEEQQSFSHSSTSCTSTSLTGTSNPKPGPAKTPSPWCDEDASGSSADTEQTRDTRRSKRSHIAQLEVSSAVSLTKFAGQQDGGAHQHLLRHHSGELSKDTKRGRCEDQRRQQRVH